MPESSTAATIDLRARPVVVEGPETSIEGQPSSNTPLPCTLHLFFDSASNAAFFKLRLPIDIEGKTFVYIFIEPEQVVRLIQDKTSDRRTEHARLCGNPARGTVCLRFTLSRPSSVAVPFSWPLPAHEVDGQGLSRVQFLARQTALVIHVPRDALSAAQTRALCSAASTHGLLKSHAFHADTSMLFQGQGGKLIEDISAITTEDDQSTASLPSYDEVAGMSQPPPEPQSQSGQSAPSKKRRLASPSPSPSPEEEAEAKVAVAERSAFLRDQMRVYVEDICQEMLAHRQAEFRKEVFAELGRMETRINANMRERIDTLKDDIVERVEEGLEQAVSRDDLEDVIDDRVAGIKIEMEDFVKDEMRAVEDKMLDHFESGTWYGSFRRPDDT